MEQKGLPGTDTNGRLLSVAFFISPLFSFIGLRFNGFSIDVDMCSCTPIHQFNKTN